MKNTPPVKLVPLSHTIIKRLFFLFAFLIIAIALITYNYLIKKMETRFQDQLLEYIVHRGERESELFRLAKDNLIRFKNEFLFHYKANPAVDFSGWFDAHMTRQSDGSMQSHPKYFDGVWAPDGSYEQGIDIRVAPGVDATAGLQRRLGIAHDLILKFGPAWRSRFVNLWFIGPEKLILTYWPDIRLHTDMSTDYNREKEEWFLKTNKKNNPGRGIVWTGLYFDSLAGQWMISTALPIDINGEQVGVIGTDLACNDFFNRNLSDSIVSSYSIILDRDGRIIVHPYKIAETLSSRNPKFTVASANDENLSTIFKKIRAVSTLPRIIDSTEDDEFLAVTKIEGPDWYLVSVYYKALFKDEIIKNVLFSIALGLGSLFAALFIIYSVVRKNISQPLGLMTETAENFNATSKDKNNLTGSLKHLNSIHSRNDEVGLLVRTFIKVGSRLRKVYQDLEHARQHLENEVENRVRELSIAKKAAETANRDKSNFLANMSHELRTPLNAILGFSRLMERDTSITPDQRENLNFIRTSGDQLLALINDVLDISKIESGNVSVNAEFFDLFHFLDNTTMMFCRQAAEKKIIFTLDKKSIRHRYVKADMKKLGQVLMNLLSNAIKYTDEGRVILTVSETRTPEKSSCSTAPPDLAADVRMRFEICDTGIGIKQEDIDIIFNQFIQAGHSHNEKSGTGLGLSISRRLVRILGGELNVRSEAGAGSTFYFDLPFETADPSQIAVSGPLSHPVGLAPGQSRFCLLVVENHRGSRTSLSRLLKLVGFKVRTARDGKQGVDHFLKYKPDLILMDIRMPVMDGLSATRKIKATEDGSRTPVIALTAHAFDNKRLEIIAAGCDDYISKPVDETALFDLLIRYLGVTFIYEAFTRPHPSPSGSAVKGKKSPPQTMAGLPEPLRMELKSASLELDANRVLSCINEIRRVDAATADYLLPYADEYRFEKILSAIEDIDSKERST